MASLNRYPHLTIRERKDFAQMSESAFAQYAVSNHSPEYLKILDKKMMHASQRAQDVLMRRDEINGLRDSFRNSVARFLYKIGRSVSRPWRFQKAPIHVQARAIEEHAYPQLRAIEERPENVSVVEESRWAKDSFAMVNLDRIIQELPADVRQKVIQSRKTL